jgi:thiamine transporter
MKTKVNSSKTIALVECAVLIALATILSMIKLYEMPWGGSVTAASMLPLIIIGYRHGIKWSILSSVVFSILQMLLGGATISAAFLPGEGKMVWYLAITMVLLDYFFAFALLGLSGLFRNKNKPARSMCLGTIVALSGRLIMHFFSGWILWGAWAQSFFEGFDETTGIGIGKWFIDTFDGQMLSCMYSLFYNALYMIPEIIITAVVTPVVYRCLLKSNMI